MRFCKQPAKIELVAPKPFTRFAYIVLALNLVVILWGAYVRASGSGAGCGSHWPLCNGEVIPKAPAVATLIEFTHRATSGLALIGVVALWLYARRLFAPASPIRRAAAWSVFFIFLEALLGAGLVVLGYVDKNASAARAAFLSIHLANTHILLAFLTAVTWLSRKQTDRIFATNTRWEWTALGAVLIVSITGAIAALGDTLFPSTSFRAGLEAELTSSAHFLLRLRIFHPVFAFVAALIVLVAAFRPNGRWVIALLLAQLLIGGINVLLAAPVPLQLLHLLSADLLWIALVVLQLEAGHRELVT